MDMEWENSGVAPFYFDWPLEVSFANRNGKIVYKKWHQRTFGIGFRAVIP